MTRRMPGQEWARREIDWVEAEALFPGCGAEWDELRWRGAGNDGPPPDFSPRDDPEVGRLIVEEDWPSGPMLRVVTADPEGKWEYPPEWRRWSDGQWSHPIPSPKVTLTHSIHELLERDTAEQFDEIFDILPLQGPSPKRVKASWAVEREPGNLEAYRALDEMPNGTPTTGWRRTMPNGTHMESLNGGALIRVQTNAPVVEIPVQVIMVGGRPLPANDASAFEIGVEVPVTSILSNANGITGTTVDWKTDPSNADADQPFRGALPQLVGFTSLIGDLAAVSFSASLDLAVTED